VPVSVGADRGHDFDRVGLTLSIAETGVPPVTLTLLAQLRPPTPDQRANLLVNAAAAAMQGGP